MSVQDSMALRDVKGHLSAVVDHVDRTHQPGVIRRHGRLAALILSVEDFASLDETQGIDGKPRLMQQIQDSLTDGRRASHRKGELLGMLVE